MSRAFVPYLEWEAISFPLVISNISLKHGYYKLSSDCQITIWRDDQFNLVGEVTGVVNRPEDLSYDPGEEVSLGSAIKPEEITGYSGSYLSCKLNGCYFTYTSHGISSEFAINFKAGVRFSSLEINHLGYPGQSEEALIDWFVGKKVGLHFPRSTTRVFDGIHKRLRDGIDKENDNQVPSRSWSGGPDYFLVKTRDFSFIVQKVTEKFAPSWGGAYCLEYRKSLGRIPTVRERESISEIVSFVLGIHLLKIGDCSYDEVWNIVTQHAQDPWGDNVVSQCGKYGMPPVSLNDPWDQVELVLNEITQSYLDLREKLELNDILWKYWIAEDMAIGSNLPVLASGLEVLADNYLNTFGPKTKYSAEEKKRYRELVKGEIESLENKLKSYTFHNQLLDRLKNPFQIGMGLKLDTFFKALDMHFGKKSLENQALLARNKMTHSSITGAEEKEVKKTMGLSKVYKILFNRALLKILGYTGEYLDFYTLEFPQRSLSENIPN